MIPIIVLVVVILGAIVLIANKFHNTEQRIATHKKNGDIVDPSTLRTFNFVVEANDGKKLSVNALANNYLEAKLQIMKTYVVSHDKVYMC